MNLMLTSKTYQWIYKINYELYFVMSNSQHI